MGDVRRCLRILGGVLVIYVYGFIAVLGVFIFVLLLNEHREEAEHLRESREEETGVPGAGS